MSNRMRLSYLVVALVTLTVASLTAILFLRFTMVKYVQENQIKDSMPFQVFFEDYYQTKGSWNGVNQVDIQKLIDESIDEKNSHYGLTLVGIDGKILLSENEAQYGDIVRRSSLVLGAPVIVSGEKVAYLYSSSRPESVLPTMDAELIKGSLVATGWAMVIGLIIAVVMSMIMTRILLRPVKTTIEAVKKISKGELNLRVSLEPYREMAELGEAVNDMAYELERNQRVQKYMLMDIAHDLRTPLSVQKATLEAFEDKVYPFDEEGLALLKMQNNQLVHLVEDLRLLTLSVAGIFTLKKKEVELQAYIQEIVNYFESIYAKKDLHLIFNKRDENYLINIDTHLMQRVFENLFQNAFQYSPEGGEVRVRVLRMINRLDVIITDQGPGIPENKLDTIFNRYYRVKPSSQGSVEGLGLGLTISRSIVGAHGGKLFARNSPKHGAEFVLELPYPV